MRNRKHTNRGVAMMEFALLLPVLTPLLLGTLWIGSAMIRQLQVQQTARDLASMYCRGVDFSEPATGTNPHTSQAEILPKLVQELGTVSASGTGVVIFSKITYVGDSVCESGGSTYWDDTSDTHKDPPCSNWGHFVFTQRYKVGNTSLHASNFGDPLTDDPDDTDHYNIPFSKYVKNSGDKLPTSFTLLPDPVAKPGGYKSGQPAYIVEVFFSGVGQIGYTSGGAYAYAIF